MTSLEERYAIDILAEEAGGYVAIPSRDDLAFLELLFATSDRFGVRYYSAQPKEKYFVGEVTRIIWEREHGIKPRPAFVA